MSWRSPCKMRNFWPNFLAFCVIPISSSVQLHDNEARFLNIMPLQLSINGSFLNQKIGQNRPKSEMLLPNGPIGPPPAKWLDCTDAPDEWLKKTCIKLRQIDRKARQALTRRDKQTVSPPSSPGNPWLQPLPVSPDTRGQVATHPFDCMTLQCLCPFFRGKMRRDGLCYLANGKPLPMAYRKEYRMLTDDERRRFHVAMNELRNRGVYRFFAIQHRSVADGGAHSGPAFLPWHREFVKRFEIALRLIDPTLAVPYWDSVIDNYLPDPRDSIFFSPMFAGDTDPNGFLVNGPFAFWRTLEGRSTILRRLGRDAQLFNERQLVAVSREPNIWNVLAYTVPFPGCPIPPNFEALEYSHTNIHFWVGGDFGTPEFSANDPIFFMHHSFVDLIFEIWRQMQQSKEARENVYTANLWNCANGYHFSNSPMAPFNTLTNLDGLSNAYTDQLYRYALRPSCTMRRPTCDSKYLFCATNRGIPHCVAKIKMGGNCAGFEGLDACFNGRCMGGFCQPGPTPAPWTPPTTAAPMMPPPRLSPMSASPASPPSASLSLSFRNRLAALRQQKKSRKMAKSRRIAAVQRGRAVMHAAPTESSAEEEWGSSNEINSTDNMTTFTSEHAGGVGDMPPLMLAFVDCFNRHPCCEQWTTLGECTRNSVYMNKYCPSACHNCKPEYNRADECADRHVSCEQWASEGECGGASKLFIEENCRDSCGLCSLPKCVVPSNSTI